MSEIVVFLFRRGPSRSDPVGELGSARFEDGKCIGSNPVVQDLIDHRLPLFDHATLWTQLMHGWSNGYVWTEVRDPNAKLVP